MAAPPRPPRSSPRCTRWPGPRGPARYPSSYPYQHTSAFNQVTSGSNGTCESTRTYLCDATGSLAGYNGPTGWGTPIGVTGFSEATTGDVVTVLNPGTVDIEKGAKLTLPIHAVDSVSTQKLTYSATGLPAGLTISSAGVISGTDTGLAGIGSVTVTATDGTPASGLVTFNLATVASMRGRLIHAAAGTVRLALGGKCLDDTNSRTTNGNKIQIYTVQRQTRRRRGRSSPTGTQAARVLLTIHGKCLRHCRPRGRLAGTGNASQQWQPLTWVAVNPAPGQPDRPAVVRWAGFGAWLINPASPGTVPG